MASSPSPSSGGGGSRSRTWPDVVRSARTGGEGGRAVEQRVDLIEAWDRLAAPEGLEREGLEKAGWGGWGVRVGKEIKCRDWCE